MFQFLGPFKRTFLAIAALAIAGALIFAGLRYQHHQHEEARTFRLLATATVLVDGVQRTGSAVQEFYLAWNYQPHLGNNGAWRVMARGEAIRIDVPGEEPIYALISAGTLFNNCAVRSQGQDILKHSLIDLTRCEIEHFPSTVRFNGSGTFDEATAVHYAGQDWNGYRFLSMSYQRTNAPITEGVSPRQAWADTKMTIKVPFGGKTHLIGLSDFKSEKFR